MGDSWLDAFMSMMPMLVTDEVCDHSGVARFIFGNTNLDLVDHVCAHVCRLGVYAASQLHEQCHEGRTEPVAHHQHRHISARNDPTVDEHDVEDDEQGGHAEHAQSDGQHGREDAREMSTKPERGSTVDAVEDFICCRNQRLYLYSTSNCGLGKVYMRDMIDNDIMLRDRILVLHTHNLYLARM